MRIDDHYKFRRYHRDLESFYERNSNTLEVNNEKLTKVANELEKINKRATHRPPKWNDVKIISENDRYPLVNSETQGDEVEDVVKRVLKELDIV